jgi:hypothetical protein
LALVAEFLHGSAINDLQQAVDKRANFERLFTSDVVKQLVMGGVAPTTPRKMLA